jgi:uncharacterized protein DUF5753/helix-turn-helix protein
MPMAHSPAVARWIVRVALRGARETESMTQGQVARSLDWSLSKIQRIESGEVTVSTTDLMAMVRHYGNVTAEDADRLIELVRVSRKGTGWWDRPEYKGHLSPSTLELVQFESEAALVRVFNPIVLPGLLQTGPYASGVIDTWAPDLDPSHKQIKLDVRRQRREKFFEREDRPGYQVLLDESVLRRQVGGGEVMVEQLEDLLDKMDAGRVELRILELDTALPASLSPFIVLGFGDPGQGGGTTDSVLYQESSFQDRIITDPDQIQSHRHSYDRMCQMAAQGINARRLVERRIRKLRDKQAK